MQIVQRTVMVCCIYLLVAQTMLGAALNSLHATPKASDGMFAVLCAPGSVIPGDDNPLGPRQADCPCGAMCTVASARLAGSAVVIAPVQALEAIAHPQHAGQGLTHKDGQGAFRPRGPPLETAFS